MKKMTIKKRILVLITAHIAACTSLLPKSETKTETPWKSFDEARGVYDSIVPNQTTVADLKRMQLDPYATPNIAILNYSDLLRKFLPGTVAQNGLLDDDIKDCLAAKQACSAYEINQRHTEQKRVGGFWSDVFNFRRETESTGWHFTAIIVMKNDRVVYKLWSGEPAMFETRSDKNPLGPLQSFGQSMGESQIRR